MAQHGKKYQEALAQVDREALYGVGEAIDIVKKLSRTSFDETVELAVRLGVDPRWFSVAALYCLQNSMVWTPCGPSAVPTGGAGVAPPASSWIFTTATTFLAMVLS